MRKLSLVLAILLATNSAFAVDTCPQVLHLCDTALDKAQTLVFEQGKQIVYYEDQSALQMQLIKDQEKKIDSPFHDPYKVAIGTAILLTVVEISLGAFRK